MLRRAARFVYVALVPLGLLLSPVLASAQDTTPPVLLDLDFSPNWRYPGFVDC